MKRLTLRMMTIILVLMLLASRRVDAETHYSVIDLGDLPFNGDIGPSASSINDHGQVVGTTHGSAGYPPGAPRMGRAFLWDNGTMTYLGGLNGNWTNSASAINDDGIILGSMGTSYCCDDPFVWIDGVIHGFDERFPGQLHFSGGDINNQGVIVGRSADGRQVKWDNWENGQVTYLTPPGTDHGSADAINDHGQIVFDIEGKAYIWDNGVMTDLGYLPGGGDMSNAADINNHGQVVGYSRTPGGAGQEFWNHAFLWQDGNMVDLGILPGELIGSSYANGINDRGQVVGGAIAIADNHAFVWEEEFGMRDLNTLLDESGAGWELTRANDINSHGWIVGDGVNPSGLDAAFLLIPIYEPGDANGDGRVDVTDLGILATNYDAGGGFGWGDGDFTGDGSVDVADLGILATNYGYGTTVASIPEPSTITLLLCGLASLLCWRRRK